VVSGRNFRYLYSVDDERIAAIERVVIGGVTKNKTTYTIRGLNNQLLSVWLTDPSTNVASWVEDEIYRGSSVLARESAAKGTTHYFLDHLGSPRAITNASGTLLGTQTFDPWGNGGTTDGGALQFTSHERDAALYGTGNTSMPDYMHARYYDVTGGRFLAMDPAMDLKKTLPNPQMWNRYAYVVNNPIRYSDPDGREHVQEPGFTKPYSEWGKALQFDEQTPTVVKAAFYAEGALLSLAVDEFIIGPAVGRMAGAVGRFFGRFVGKADEAVEAGSKLSRYEDVTSGRSVANRATNASRADFGKNLEANGFTKSVSKDGKVTIFQKDAIKYTIRDTAKSTGGPTAEVFKDGKLLQKIRLEVPQ
jgi:RHS repeat-associated protein